MRLRQYRVPIGALAFIFAGAGASFSPDGSRWRFRIWMAGLVITSAPMLWGTLRGMVRGRFAADIIAALAVITAVVLRQPIVGLVIVLMQTGGEALERLAEGKASDALRALEDAAPKIVHRMSGESIDDVGVDDVREGDKLLVRPGEMIPCDGSVVEGDSDLDTASITGEPVPRKIGPGSPVMSGSVNQHGPIVVQVSAIASETNSTFICGTAVLLNAIKKIRVLKINALYPLQNLGHFLELLYHCHELARHLACEFELHHHPDWQNIVLLIFLLLIAY